MTRRKQTKSDRVFKHRNGNVYAFSERNKFGEYVVIQMKVNEHHESRITGTKVIPAKNVKHLMKLINTVPWERFSEMPK